MKNNVTLIQHAKGLGAVKIEKVKGPNGAFMSLLLADGKKVTMPIGKKSQEGKVADYKVLIADNGTAIATTNNYSTEEAVDL